MIIRSRPAPNVGPIDITKFIEFDELNELIANNPDPWLILTEEEVEELKRNGTLPEAYFIEV